MGWELHLLLPFHANYHIKLGAALNFSISNAWYHLQLKSWGLEVSPFATISFKIYDSLFLSLNFLLPSQMLPLHSTLVRSCSYVCLVGFSCHKWHTLFLTLLNLKSWGLEVSTSATLTFKMPYKTKVKTLWEDHTIWKNLPHVLSFTKERQNVGHFVKCLCPLQKTSILSVLHDH